MASLRTYWHTLRHLRPVQIYGRLRFRLARPVPDLRPAPVCRALSGEWQVPALRAASMTGPETFRFLNEEHVLSDTGWDSPAIGRLWRYNLHYFDDLNAEGAADRAGWHHTLFRRWVEGNSPGRGTGWEPYPVSLRMVNWIKWSLGGGALPPECVESLAVQARWLSNRLERHLLGNHLWANAKALIFAGCYFSGPEADRWLRKGSAVLLDEIREQILPDGGHFERSPMYHAILLEDLLDLLNLSSCFPLISPPLLRQCRKASGDMLRWLQVMTHPDGKIAFFNDAAFGIAPEYAVLAAYAQRVGLQPPAAAPGRVEALPESGYVRLSAGPAVVICDVAPVGPGYLPGHAHADTLSFELSLDGRRVLVNGGTSTYEPGALRSRQRGTPAHNTVSVDGRDSSEVWGVFRTARRAKPFGVRWGEDDAAAWLEASHDGYRHLSGRVSHGRRWTLSTRGLNVEDRLDGAFSEAVAMFLFHPDLHPASGSERECRVSAAGMRVASTGRCSLEPASWYPEFGGRVEAAALKVLFQGPALTTTMEWQ